MRTQWIGLLTVVMLALARIGSAQGVADLRLDASVAPNPVIVGDDLVYTISITNQGPMAATGVVVSNQLPLNVTFVSATGGSTPTNGALLLNLGTLAAGATSSAQIVVQPTIQIFNQSSLDVQLTNMFQVFANETDPDPANNSATVLSYVVVAVPGTPITWIDSGGTEVVTYSIAFGGEPRPIQVGSGGNPASTCQPGEIVLLTDPNGGNNSTNWAAVVRFFNPSDPTGTNNLAATYSQAFFPSDFGSNGFASFRLIPPASFIQEYTATTTNDVTTITASYDEFGPADAILSGQLNVDIITVSSGALLLTITQTNNEAIVSWSPSVTGWTLQTNNNLATGMWGNYAGAVVNNSVTNLPLTGNLFFRLVYP